jgi:hypothetical protein
MPTSLEQAKPEKEFTVSSASAKSIKVGLFGVDLEVPIGSITDWAKKMGKNVLTTVVVRGILKMRVRSATEDAWDCLGRSSELLGLALQHYMQQGAVPREMVQSLNKAIAQDAVNPPASPYGDVFILPAERRLQLAWQAMEESQKIAMPLKSFGEFLNENPELRDAIYSESARTWKKIEKVRSLVFSQVRTWADNQDFDEELAWMHLAPEAMNVAKRFQLLTDHPWTETEAYGKTGTVFMQALRKEAWLSEKWSNSVEKVNRRSLRLDDFQDTVDYFEITQWTKKIQKMEGQHVIQKLKAMLEAWDAPHAIALALVSSGTTQDLKEWVEEMKRKCKADGKTFDVNLMHPSVCGNTLFDQVLSRAPHAQKRAMAEVLLAEGAVLNRAERCGPGNSEYVLLMDSLRVDYSEAKEWVGWLKSNMKTPELSFNVSGRNEMATAIKEQKIEWAGALMEVHEQQDAALDTSGNGFGHYWSEYQKTKSTDRSVLTLSTPAYDVLEKHAPKTENAMVQDRMFWLDIDSRLTRLGSLPPQTPQGAFAPASSAKSKKIG